MGARGRWFDPSRPDHHLSTIMTDLTYNEFELQFDEIMSRVGSGESFRIEYENNYFALIPYDTHKNILDEYSKLYIVDNNEAQ